LDVAADPMSLDCGGHCWGCVGLVEFKSGDRLTSQTVTDEIRKGLRDEGGHPLI
jgi:hypothetical protein